MGKKIQLIGKYSMDGLLLGKGNFARVELATHTVTQCKVAIKVMDTRKIKEDYVRLNLHREARLMAQLRHPNIVRLYETLRATTLYCLVLEYAAGGDLLTYIKQQPDSRLSEKDGRPYLRQLISALHYIHDRNVVHRDLKTDNIMLDETKQNIKLIDFGLSNVYREDEPLRTHCGSPEYAAPELFLISRTYGPEIDIWSFGIIMYAMLVGRLPFRTLYKDEYQRQQMLLQIQRGLSVCHEREMQFLSTDCRNLIRQLIEPNPHLRLPLTEIEHHPWTSRNGKLIFSPYVPLPRDKLMRNQVIGELTFMSGQQRKVLLETVQENKADELSAMYNMLLDKKRRDLGLMDKDHTTRKLPKSRSRSADRTAAVALPGGKGKAPVSKKSGSSKKGIGKQVPSPRSNAAPSLPEQESRSRARLPVGLPACRPASSSIPNGPFQLNKTLDLSKPRSSGRAERPSSLACGGHATLPIGNPSSPAPNILATGATASATGTGTSAADTTASVTGTTASASGTGTSATGTTASVTGATASVAGATASVAGATASVAGATASVAGATASVAGATASVAGTTVSVTGATTSATAATVSVTGASVSVTGTTVPVAVPCKASTWVGAASETIVRSPALLVRSSATSRSQSPLPTATKTTAVNLQTTTANGSSPSTESIGISSLVVKTEAEVAWKSTAVAQGRTYCARRGRVPSAPESPALAPKATPEELTSSSASSICDRCSQLERMGRSLDESSGTPASRILVKSGSLPLPQSPAPGRFCHTGAHALDLFVSPDEELWRALVDNTFDLPHVGDVSPVIAAVSWDPAERAESLVAVRPSAISPSSSSNETLARSSTHQINAASRHQHDPPHQVQSSSHDIIFRDRHLQLLTEASARLLESRRPEDRHLVDAPHSKSPAVALSAFELTSSVSSAERRESVEANLRAERCRASRSSCQLAEKIVLPEFTCSDDSATAEAAVQEKASATTTTTTGSAARTATRHIWQRGSELLRRRDLSPLTHRITSWLRRTRPTTNSRGNVRNQRKSNGSAPLAQVIKCNSVETDRHDSQPSASPPESLVPARTSLSKPRSSRSSLAKSKAAEARGKDDRQMMEAILL